MLNERLECGDLVFEVRRSGRRKTLGVTVDRGGALVLHAPAEQAREDLFQWAHGKLLWIHRKLALKESVRRAVRSPEYVGGESFRYLGHRYRLMIVSDQEVPLKQEEGRFLLRKDAVSEAADHFRNWYVATGGAWVAGRVAMLARKVGAHPDRLEVRELGYRWGSCGMGRAVYLNWKLFQLPVRLADYVIAHELAHLVEHNHGTAFRALLNRSLPDWRERQEELISIASELFWCHPGM